MRGEATHDETVSIVWLPNAFLKRIGDVINKLGGNQ